MVRPVKVQNPVQVAVKRGHEKGRYSPFKNPEEGKPPWASPGTRGMR